MARALAALALMGGLAWTAGCGRCAHGPSYILPETINATAGQAIDARFALRPTPETSTLVLTAAEPSDAMPAGLTATIDGEDLRLSGTVADAGSYAFTVLLQEQRGNVCAGWARYDVTLDVATP